jgi:hypothetical protein
MRRSRLSGYPVHASYDLLLVAVGIVLVTWNQQHEVPQVSIVVWRKSDERMFMLLSSEL